MQLSVDCVLQRLTQCDISLDAERIGGQTSWKKSTLVCILKNDLYSMGHQVFAYCFLGFLQVKREAMAQTSTHAEPGKQGV